MSRRPGALPAKYRRASNIHEGYEIRTTGDQGGGVFTTIPSDDVMSRRTTARTTAGA